MTAYLQTAAPAKLWAVWAIAAIVTVLVALPTLTITPTLWQDEVQILDFGRVGWPGADRSYAMTWLPGGRAAQVLTYLGAYTQEAAYRLAGGSPVGPRLSAILGAYVASLALMGWLLARGTLPWVALGCALIFLWDPLFVEGYRGARVDSWAMAFMLFALWSVRAAGGRQQSSLGPARWQVVAGLCVAVAGLIWVSAILLVPLLIYEVLAVRRFAGAPWMGAVVDLLWVGAIAALFIALLLLPQLSHLSAMVDGLRAGTGKRVVAGIDVIGLLQPYARSPWVPLAAVASLFISRSAGLALALVAAVAGVLVTEAYVHRAIYLSPYFMAAIAGGATTLLAKPRPRWLTRWAVYATFAVMLGWSGGMTLAARTYLALKEAEGRNPTVLIAMTEQEIGPGPHKVYLGNWELYYAGRGLGWQQFKMSPEDWNDESFLALIRQMDHVIFSPNHSKRPTEELMAQLGFNARTATTSGPVAAANIGNRATASKFSEYVIYSR
jgi:hypothetical protein